MKLCHVLTFLGAFLTSFVLGGRGGLVSSLLGEVSSVLGHLLVDNCYQTSCPQAQEIVREITWSHTSKNPALAAKLLRMHFHDCFVRGCDGSILLNSTADNTAEKDAIPNLSLAGFDVIDEIKRKLESECEKTVSCADILALAARDAVSYQFGKSMWDVKTGRKDGKISRDTEALANLPSPLSSFSTLKQGFSSKGLSVRDLVVLSGGHTIGIGHCNLFSNRLYNFTGKGDQDPSLNSTYASFLKTKCPNLAATSQVDMDPGSAQNFDPHYFVGLKQNSGMFQSDAALLTDAEARQYVDLLVDPKVFNAEFAKSMLNMGAILTGNAGEIRRDCRVVNS
ncbi:peroxidase 1-like [Coffea arabica]|uniref:Peroxidase n=1 Tax=Coffea arabica TaxID=13443 RepID=A0A6P6SP13_COFAR|nr:peroxidase 2-like [Coffea arabica]